MSKPARLYPKPEPAYINPRFLLIGSIVFAVLFAAFGLMTAPVRIF